MTVDGVSEKKSCNWGRLGVTGALITEHGARLPVHGELTTEHSARWFAHGELWMEHNV